MATLLHVKTSIFGDDGKSSQLSNTFIENWKSKNPDGKVVTRDLVATTIPHLDAARVGALFSDETRTPEQQSVLDLANELLEEVKSADALVIGVPMYNFNVPTQLKAWFDMLARAGVTFKYTENGPVGLLEDKPVYLMIARGGLYKEAGLDFQIPYVKQFLGFIGLSSVTEVYAEGLNMGEEMAEKALAAAKTQIAAL